MSDASKKRRTTRRTLNGVALSDEDRRAQLREDPLVQSLIGEAVRAVAKRATPHIQERDAFARSLAVLLARMPGGRVVLRPEEVAAARGYKLQTLLDKGTVVHYVIRDEHDMAAAALREKAAASGLVLP